MSVSLSLATVIGLLGLIATFEGLQLTLFYGLVRDGAGREERLAQAEEEIEENQTLAEEAKETAEKALQHA